MISSLFFAIITGLVIRNYHLARVLFYDWDEGMYAQIAKEIIQNKSIWTTFNGHIWLDKPPLVHVLIAFIMAVFGQSEFWMRMISVTTGALLLYFVYLLAKKISFIFADKSSLTEINLAAILPVLIIAASPIFMERTSLLNSDIFVALSWLGYFLYRDRYWLKLFFLTLGVWSKSILGFYPLVIDVANLILIKLLCFVRNKSKRHPELGSGSYLKQKEISKQVRYNILHYILLLIVPSFWYIAGLIKFGRFFIDNHFFSQVFKRLYVPIELHFGNKYFYLEYLWKNLGLINLFIIFAYILFFISFIRLLIKERKKLIRNSLWFSFIVFISPLLFLTLLTLMKTKITWYVIIFLPLLLLPISFLYFRLKKRILKILLVAAVSIYFLTGFFSQTLFMQIVYSPPDRLKLAQCLNKSKVNILAFLVNDEERKVRNFLEAAHYQTTSSFFYGGSPSFVYYVGKKVDFYYSVDDFIKNIGKYSLIVFSKKDAKNPYLTNKLEKNPVKCQFGEWLSL